MHEEVKMKSHWNPTGQEEALAASYCHKLGHIKKHCEVCKGQRSDKLEKKNPKWGAFKGLSLLRMRTALAARVSVCWYNMPCPMVITLISGS